jgi:hypothetical protein
MKTNHSEGTECYLIRAIYQYTEGEYKLAKLKYTNLKQITDETNTKQIECSRYKDE